MLPAWLWNFGVIQPGALLFHKLLLFFKMVAHPSFSSRSHLTLFLAARFHSKAYCTPVVEGIIVMASLVHAAELKTVAQSSLWVTYKSPLDKKCCIQCIFLKMVFSLFCRNKLWGDSSLTGYGNGLGPCPGLVTQLLFPARDIPHPPGKKDEVKYIAGGHWLNILTRVRGSACYTGCNNIWPLAGITVYV